jgi:hypothetical protein
VKERFPECLIPLDQDDFGRESLSRYRPRMDKEVKHILMNNSPNHCADYLLGWTISMSMISECFFDVPLPRGWLCC